MFDLKPSTDLAAYVVGSLPEGYLITANDIAWLEECATFLQGPLTAMSVLQAVKDAVARHGLSMHIDPYELLIDAGICDATLNLLQEP
jgi:hypothetical protein